MLEPVPSAGVATGNLMAGKKGLIMGVANNRSIAWGIAKAAAAQGAEIALTYQGDAIKKRVGPLATELGSKLVLPCDVMDASSVDAVFAEDAGPAPAGAPYLLAKSGDAQAAFFSVLLALHCQDSWIDDHQLLRRGQQLRDRPGIRGGLAQLGPLVVDLEAALQRLEERKSLLAGLGLDAAMRRVTEEMKGVGLSSLRL